MYLLTTHYSYLVILLVSLFGLSLADYHYKLVIFDQPRAAIYTILATIGLFICWDIAGILFRVFFTNQSYVIGWWIATPDLPIEEFLFLTMLSYVSLICYRVVVKFLGEPA